MIVLLALAAPPAFVQVVEQRLASAHMHLVDWWADDLDGDRMPESIALACNEDSGVYWIQHGTQVLEMPAPIDGRNACPDAAPGKPPWHVEHTGTIAYGLSVHHGRIDYTVAIRDGRLALLREHDDGIEVDSSGTTDETDDVDYEALTWKTRVVPPNRTPTVSSGPLVIVTDRVRRATKLIGASTIAATRGPDGSNTITLHVHADRVLALSGCTNGPCAAARLATGDSELTENAGGAFEIAAGGTTIHVHTQPLDGDQSYRPPPAAM
jgi:hypothetical protein